MLSKSDEEVADLRGQLRKASYTTNWNEGRGGGTLVLLAAVMKLLFHAYPLIRGNPIGQVGPLLRV